MAQHRDARFNLICNISTKIESSKQAAVWNHHRLKTSCLKTNRLNSFELVWTWYWTRLYSYDNFFLKRFMINVSLNKTDWNYDEGILKQWNIFIVASFLETGIPRYDFYLKFASFSFLFVFSFLTFDSNSHSNDNLF